MIYYISGLGADERVFRYLDLGDVEFKHIRWETPEKDEALEDYCGRLITQIDLSGEVILIGVSFGGIVAQEIARKIRPAKVIILSSVKSVNEFDWQLSFVRKLRLYQLVPSRLLKWSNKLTGDYYFGVQTKTESKLLGQIIGDTDRHFMKWAIREIMNWKGNSTSDQIIHIHGDKDRIFPVSRIHDFIRVENAGHFMIVNRASEIAAYIKDAIGHSAIAAGDGCE